MSELRQTVRRLSQSLGFTLTVLLTLALGIGGTTAIFSVVNGILIKPLPYPESERLIALQLHSRDTRNINASAAIYFTYRDNNRTFDSVALYSLFTNSITGSGDPEQVWSVEATYEFCRRSASSRFSADRSPRRMIYRAALRRWCFLTLIGSATSAVPKTFSARS